MVLRKTLEQEPSKNVESKFKVKIIENFVDQQTSLLYYNSEDIDYRTTGTFFL